MRLKESLLNDSLFRGLLPPPPPPRVDNGGSWGRCWEDEERDKEAKSERRGATSPPDWSEAVAPLTLRGWGPQNKQILYKVTQAENLSMKRNLVKFIIKSISLLY